MNPKTLSVTLTGSDADSGDVNLDNLRQFCSALKACLAMIEDRLELDSRLSYRIVGLKKGSVGATFRPTLYGKEAEDGPKVLGIFNKTVRALENKRRVDKIFGAHDLKLFKNLATPFQSEGKKIKFGRFGLTQNFINTIDSIVTTPLVADGEATGFLEKVNVHQKNEFSLYPVIGGMIVCEFSDKLLKDVGKSLKKNVTVIGQLKYTQGRKFPDHATVERIITHPDDSQLPTIFDLGGILKHERIA